MPQVYVHNSIRHRGVRILRVFLALTFVLAALLCSLSRYGLHKSHWTDCAVGLALGGVIALYVVSGLWSSQVKI